MTSPKEGIASRQSPFNIMQVFFLIINSSSNSKCVSGPYVSIHSINGKQVNNGDADLHPLLS